MALSQKKTYTIKDIYALPEGQRAELIDGQMYMMAPPNRIHQRLSHLLDWTIENYIRDKIGDCEVYPAPFSVFLNEDDQNYVEPDISVICDSHSAGAAARPTGLLKSLPHLIHRTITGLSFSSTALRAYVNTGL